MMQLVQDDNIVKNLIKGFVLESDLKNKKNIDYIKRLRKSISYIGCLNFNPVGYLIVSKGDDQFDFIEYVLTFIRGEDIGKQMIQCYENQFTKVLIPYEITNDSVGYWYRFYNSKGYDTPFKLFMYLASYGLKDPKMLKWDPLIIKHLNKAYQAWSASQS
jgi:hypothetical protein